MDVHTHVMSPELASLMVGPGSPPSTADDLIDRLDEAHVRQAVVLSLAYFQVLPDDAAVQAENDYTAAEVRKYPDRLIGFCGVNPLRASALDEIDRCADELGMRGIKLHLPSSGVDLKLPDHVAAVSAVFDRARDRDLPVLMHSGYPPGLPLDSDALANLGSIIATHPEVRLVLAHCTNDADRSEMEIWLEALDQGFFNNENLFVDTSSCLNFYKDAPKAQKELMVWRIRKWGIERVFFASDYLMVAPDATPAEALDIINSYPFTRKELSTILANDASTWLTG
jgi:predicted TIM-barrel fold metal-dependent hydrolase